MEPLKLHLALQALGQDVVGCDSNGNVQGNDLDQALIGLVVAALEKPWLSAENIALRDYLGGAKDPRWIAYKNERRRPIGEARLVRFQKLTDSMFLKAFELSEGARDVTINTVQYRLPLSSKIQAWQDAKDAIRTELKYPDEE